MGETRPHSYMEGVPEWMAEHGVKKGEYLMLTKAQLKTRQRPGNPLKVQVWATGILHTAGYRGQKAVTLMNGKKRPLTPADIIKELHAIAKQFYRDGGIEATEEELEKLKETKETIRRVLAELEDDGVALRTDLSGKKLSDLSEEELHRLSSGKILMYFWLKPKNAATGTVSQEWEKQQRLLRVPNVGKNLLPHFSIRKILNLFDVGKFTKKQISAPEFQSAVTHSYEAARTAFLQTFEVDMRRLPSEVVTPRSPEVDAGGGALERIGGKDSKSSSSAGKRTTDDDENQRTAPSAEREEANTQPPDLFDPKQFHAQVCKRFVEAGKPTPGPKLTKPIFEALHGQQAPFLEFLTPARLQPIRSAGVLPDLLQNFLDHWQNGGAAREAEYQAEIAREKQHTAQQYLETAQAILSRPAENSQEDIEWANAILNERKTA